MSDERRRPVGTWIVRVIGALVGLLLIFAVANRRDRVVGLNTPIQFDDFAFVVRDAAPDPASGRYRVGLEVINKARRVDYRFERSGVLLVDDEGRWCRPVAPAGPAGSAPVVLKAGTCHTEPLVFKLPRGLREPHLMVSFGPVGDVLETLFFGRKRIKLP